MESSTAARIFFYLLPLYIRPAKPSVVQVILVSQTIHKYYTLTAPNRKEPGFDYDSPQLGS